MDKSVEEAMKKILNTPKKQKNKKGWRTIWHEHPILSDLRFVEICGFLCQKPAKTLIVQYVEG